MDRIVFKKQIDSIYEKLYSINESLSSENSKELIRGFNDGIKEGYELFNENINNLNEWNPFKSVAKGVGIAKGATKGLWNQGKQAVASTGNAISNVYQQGKQLATEIWGKIQTMIQKISKGISSAATWIVKQPGEIKTKLTAVMNEALDELKSAYDAFKDKAEEFKTSITKFWDTMKTNVTTTIKNAKDALVKAGIATEETAKQWILNNKIAITTAAQELQQSSVAWMKTAGKKVLEGLTAVGNGTLTALKFIFKAVIIMFITPFHVLYLGIKQIPDLYAKSKDVIEAGINKLGESWMEAETEGENIGLAATTPSTGKIPVRDPKTGRMMPAGTPVEHKIFKFSDFVTEKKRKEEFFKKLK